MTRPAISQDLTVLRGADLLVERRACTRRFYRARPEWLAELRSWLENSRDDRLEALKREAELAEGEV